MTPTLLPCWSCGSQPDRKILSQENGLSLHAFVCRCGNSTQHYSGGDFGWKCATEEWNDHLCRPQNMERVRQPDDYAMHLERVIALHNTKMQNDCDDARRFSVCEEDHRDEAMCRTCPRKHSIDVPDHIFEDKR